MFARSAIRTTRNFSAATKGKVYREKTWQEAWLHDKGSWPVIACISGALVFCAAASAYFTFAHPDSRITKTARKSVFRGELRGVDNEN